MVDESVEDEHSLNEMIRSQLDAKLIEKISQLTYATQIGVLLTCSADFSTETRPKNVGDEQLDTKTANIIEDLLNFNDLTAELSKQSVRIINLLFDYLKDKNDIHFFDQISILDRFHQIVEVSDLNIASKSNLLRNYNLKSSVIISCCLNRLIQYQEAATLSIDSLDQNQNKFSSKLNCFIFKTLSLLRKVFLNRNSLFAEAQTNSTCSNMTEFDMNQIYTNLDLLRMLHSSAGFRLFAFLLNLFQLLV